MEQREQDGRLSFSKNRPFGFVTDNNDGIGVTAVLFTNISPYEIIFQDFYPLPMPAGGP
jgi:hypothetical protein